MGVKGRLSLMMFLQYAIWGAWLPLLWPFLAGHRGFTAGEIGNIFVVGGIGALLAPFIAGQIADRWFSTQHFLALSHLLGAGLVWKLATIDTYSQFLFYSLLYSIVYAPTLALTNSITLHHIEDRDRDFGKIRLWGTIGWIVVGLAMGQWLLQRWTPGQDTATVAVIETRVLDPEGRQHLLEDSRLTLKNKDVIDGRAVREADGAVVLTTLLPDPDRHGWPKEGTLNLPGGPSVQLPDVSAVWKEGATLSRRFEAERVDTLVPMVQAITSVPDEDRASQAAMLERLARGLETDPSTLAQESVRQELLAEAPFNKAALQIPIGAEQDQGRSDAFRLSALLGVLLGVFCLFLPHTPPQKGQQPFAAAEAFGQIKVNPLLTLFLLAVPVSCIHQFYFVHTSGFLSASGVELNNAFINRVFGVGGGGLMTLGQISELAVLALIPLVAKKMARKWLLAVGLLAYGLRMALFAYPEMFPLPTALTLMTGVAMHGLCFGCFIFVSFMIVDEETSGDVRASAQSLYNLVIIGVGIIVGSKIAAWVQEWATTGEQINYTRLFSVPMWASFVCLALLVVLYPSRRPGASAPGA